MYKTNLNSVHNTPCTQRHKKSPDKPGFRSFRDAELGAVFFECRCQVRRKRFGGAALDVVALDHVHELAIFKERH